MDRSQRKQDMRRAGGRSRSGAITILVVYVSAISAFFAATSSRAQLAPVSSSWPMFHHDLNHSGLSPFSTRANSGALRWSFATGNHVESSPSIGPDGTIYFGSDDGNVYAVNSSASLKWKFTTQNSQIVLSSPAIGSDGTI